MLLGSQSVLYCGGTPVHILETGFHYNNVVHLEVCAEHVHHEHSLVLFGVYSCSCDGNFSFRMLKNSH